MESFRPNSRTNPYLLQLYRSLGEIVDVSPFSWRRALTGRYDVFHLHWPEVLLRGRTRSRAVARAVAFALVLIRLRAGNRALVRTLHNVEPHEALGRVQRWLVGRADRSTGWWITLTSTTLPPVSTSSVSVIPHGHYRDWFAATSPRDAVAGRLLFFGLVRPYKGIENLLQAFRAVQDDALTLRIVGSPTETALVEAIDEARRFDHRVSARLEHVDDAALAREVQEAELVVLPYTKMVNSGALLLALSLSRPVLVPAGPSTEELAEEVGRGWVIRFAGQLTAETLVDGLTAAGQPRETAHMADRAWPAIAIAHVETFTRAKAATGVG